MLVPLVVWLVGWPGPALILLGASIPITYSITGGRGGFNLTASDVLLVLVGAAVLFQATVTGSLPALAALRPLFRAVLPYSFLLLLLLAVHLSVSDLAQTGQRFELFGLSLLVGAFAALNGRHIGLLKAYVVAAAVLAAVWPFAHNLGQKNPVGQMIANAILLLLGVRALRRYVALALVLVPGLILTGSRGALVATAVGILVILALQESRVQAAFIRVSIVALLAYGTYRVSPNLAPSSAYHVLGWGRFAGSLRSPHPPAVPEGRDQDHQGTSICRHRRRQLHRWNHSKRDADHGPARGCASAGR